MSSQCSVKIDGTKAHIKIVGRFDFKAHREFREVCAQISSHSEVKTVDVDLSNVEYIDSSALGMLLLLKDQAESAHRALALIRTPPSVRKILEVANFHKLLTVA